MCYLVIILSALVSSFLSKSSATLIVRFVISRMTHSTISSSFPNLLHHFWASKRDCFLSERAVDLCKSISRFVFAFLLTLLYHGHAWSFSFAMSSSSITSVNILSTKECICHQYHLIAVHLLSRNHRKSKRFNQWWFLVSIKWTEVFFEPQRRHYQDWNESFKSYWDCAGTFTSSNDEDSGRLDP